MAELVWKGKRGSRSISAGRALPTLHTKEIYGDGAVGNRLIAGDRLDVLESLSDVSGAVSLVYLDPPFGTGKEFEHRVTIPGAAPQVARVTLPAFRDGGDLDAWLEWFLRTAVAIHKILATGGSLYVHLDAHAGHYAKVVLDEVFGAHAFQREVIWRIGWISGFKSKARSWIRNHDTILFYAKGGRPKTFHKEYVPYAPEYRRRDGSAPRSRGYPVEDVWNASDLDRLDSIQIKSFSREKVGYPTQKNEALVARIVRASSDPGDWVLDCCGGSGTTAVVSERLGRRWIVSDVSRLAIHTARKRILQLPQAASFVVQHAEGGRARSTVEKETRSLRLKPRLQGREVTLDLVGFNLPATRRPKGVGAKGVHWSQWIDGWCVDWDSREGSFRGQARLGRAEGESPLPLEVTHTYARAGRYDVVVKAFDIFGGTTTRVIHLTVE